MDIITFTYKYTRHHRTVEAGGLDSEYSHSTVEQAKFSVVIPSREPMFLDMARSLLARGKSSDPAFEFLSSEIDRVDFVVSSPQSRL